MVVKNKKRNMSGACYEEILDDSHNGGNIGLLFWMKRISDKDDVCNLVYLVVLCFAPEIIGQKGGEMLDDISVSALCC